MADILVTDAMAEVRAYLGDSHPADRGATPASDLIKFLQREYDPLWERCSKDGPVTTVEAARSTTPLTWVDDVPGAIDIPSDVLAVIAVFQYDGTSGGSYRYLTHAQPGNGPLPFGQERGTATHFAVYGLGDTATLQLWPYPGLSSQYYLAYLPKAKTLTTSGTPGPTETNTIVGLPSQGIDRMILGAYRRSLLARRESSPQLNDLIRAADADLGLHLASKVSGESPRVKNTDYKYRGWYRRGQDVTPTMLSSAPRTAWIWLY